MEENVDKCDFSGGYGFLGGGEIVILVVLEVLEEAREGGWIVRGWSLVHRKFFSLDGLASGSRGTRGG